MRLGGRLSPGEGAEGRQAGGGVRGVEGVPSFTLKGVESENHQLRTFPDLPYFPRLH